MSVERVKEYFRQFGMEDRIMEFEISSATVELAAKAVGTEPARIAKSISFLVNDKAVLIITAGDTKIDNHRFKDKFGVKAKMLTPDQVIEMIGHAIGGVCPFGINDGVDVYLDESMKRFDTVFPASGSINSCIKLSIPELEKYSNYNKWIDVTEVIAEE